MKIALKTRGAFSSTKAMTCLPIGAASSRRRSTSRSPRLPGVRRRTGSSCALPRRTSLAMAPAERVRVYEKIRSGIWTYNGLFELVDGWLESDSRRMVCKFRLELLDEQPTEPLALPAKELEHARLIPTAVKLEVWRRDRARCVECGSTDNLHFDHIVPYSKGGSSLVAENIQLLCARHNLAKAAHIR